VLFRSGFLREMRIRESLDLSRLTLEETVELFDRTSRAFLTEDYVRAETINIAADFYFKMAVRDLEKAGLDPVAYLSQVPKTLTSEAMDSLARIGRGEAELSEFMKIYGHRAPQDYELSHPRFHESPDVAMSMASRSARGSERTVTASTLPPIEKRVLRLAVERATRYQALKEDAKHHAMRELAFLRALVLDIGRRIGVGEGVFYLTPTELRCLGQVGFEITDASRRILERQEIAEALRVTRMPREVTVVALESMDVESGSDLIIPRGAGNLRGTRVSGSGDVSGRARVLRRAEEIDLFQKGEILVARFTDPTWTSVFPLARGIVTEVGGWLSHAAIQAREYDITGIVGAAGALDALVTGELLCLRADGTIEQFGNRRLEDRVPISIPVDLRRQSETISARLADLSPNGALLHLSGRSLTVGEEIGIDTPAADAGVLEATVVRNGIPGVYGVRFRRTLQAKQAGGLGVDLNTRTVQGAA
jgi:phosphohistidine swiveling domain-containing protein